MPLTAADIDRPRRKPLTAGDIEPKEKSLGQKLLTGPKEFVQSLEESGAQIPSIGTVQAPNILKGLVRGAVEFPFRATKEFAQAQALYGKDPAGIAIATGQALAPQTMEFARKPSVEQGSRAVTELAQYALPGIVGKGLGKLKVKPKMKTVATSLEGLKDVKEQLPIKKELPSPRVFEDQAMLSKESAEYIKERRAKQKNPPEPPMEERRAQGNIKFTDEDMKKAAENWGLKFKHIEEPMKLKGGKEYPKTYSFDDPLSENTTISFTHPEEIPGKVFESRKSFSIQPNEFQRANPENFANLQKWVANQERLRSGEFVSQKESLAPGGTEPPQPPPPVAKAAPAPEPSGEPLINPKTFAELSPELKTQLVSEAEKLRPQLEKVANEPLSNERVLSLAAEVKGTIEAFGREQAEAISGASEKLRQITVRDLKNGSATPELQEAIRQWVDRGTAGAQINRARQISYDVSPTGKVKTRTAVPEWVKLKQKAIRKLQDLKIAAEQIQIEIDKVDWQNETSVMDFNRKYSTKLQRLAHDINAYRYINMLSDPRSPARNLLGNVFNAVFTRPAEMLGEAAIESPKALLGKERSTYFSQIPAYYRGLKQGVGAGKQAAKEVYQGKRAIRKPDLEREMSSAKILRPFERATLGTLEATDLAVRETIKRAETLSEAVKAKKQGKTINPAEVRDIAKRAEGLAEDLLYRSKIDWKNESGQGAMSSAFDAFHAAVKYVAEKKYIGPPTRLLQPFINIAIKVPKMGAQFTPGIGALDLIGGKNPKRIISRQFVGGVFSTWAAMKALDGDLIYRAPVDPEQKKAFYAQNKKEFSIKIGDRYVPLVYFGPFAFPMVLAGAINYYFREDPNRFDKNTAQKVAAVGGAWVRYMSNQGVMLGLPVFLSELQEGLKTGTITNVAKQFWPLQGTQRWLAQLTDREYRKPKGGFDFDAFLDQMQKDIPGLSQYVPPADATGPQHPLPLLPYPITRENPAARPLFEYRQLELEENAKMRRLMKEAGVE